MESYCRGSSSGGKVDTNVGSCEECSWVDVNVEGAQLLNQSFGSSQEASSETMWAKNFEEARVFVEVDLEKKLPEYFSFKSSTGVDKIVYYDFPWLLPRCRSCGKQRHETIDCRACIGDKHILKRNSTAPTKEKIQNTNNVEDSHATMPITTWIEEGSKHKEKQGMKAPLEFLLAQTLMVLENEMRREVQINHFQQRIVKSLSPQQIHEDVEIKRLQWRPLSLAHDLLHFWIMRQSVKAMLNRRKSQKALLQGKWRR